jgi:site-specific DNA-methyltransferase (adenine-specific)
MQGNGGVMATVELIQGDCLDVMRGMEAESIDLIFTSPPYNLGNVKKGGYWQGNKGDSISYDLHNDNMDQQEYIEWQQQIIKELYRLIKNTGAIFYNHKPRINKGQFDNRLNLIPYPIRQEIIWDRCAMINFSGSFYAPNTERIFIIAKKEWRPNQEYLGWGEVWRIPADINNPHPVPFPLSLAKRVVVSASNENDIVLDPFSGSATTGIACIQNNRNYIGIELSAEYMAIAQERIRVAQMQPNLFEGV